MTRANLTPNPLPLVEGEPALAWLGSFEFSAGNLTSDPFPRGKGNNRVGRERRADKLCKALLDKDVRLAHWELLRSITQMLASPLLRTTLELAGGRSR